MFTNNFALLSQRVKEHVEADSIIQGDYWDSEKEKGCFIGCLARVKNPRKATIYNEKTYGLPILLQRIAENIFESLPSVEAKKFFASLPEAIGQDGKDLTNIHWKFLASELRSIPQQSVELQRLIDQVIDGMEMLSQSIQWSEAEAAEIANAAEAAGAADGWAAARAVWAAAYASQAADDYWLAAARSVNAAGAAYWAARAASNGANTFSAAYEASRLRQRDSLLRLIKEAPVKPV